MYWPVVVPPGGGTAPTSVPGVSGLSLASRSGYTSWISPWQSATAWSPRWAPIPDPTSATCTGWFANNTVAAARSSRCVPETRGRRSSTRPGGTRSRSNSSQTRLTGIGGPTSCSDMKVRSGAIYTDMPRMLSFSTFFEIILKHFFNETVRIFTLSSLRWRG